MVFMRRLFLENQKHTAWPLFSDSWISHYWETDLFSDSENTAWPLLSGFWKFHSSELVIFSQSNNIQPDHHCSICELKWIKTVIQYNQCLIPENENESVTRPMWTWVERIYSYLINWLRSKVSSEKTGITCLQMLLGLIFCIMIFRHHLQFSLRDI